MWSNPSGSGFLVREAVPAEHLEEVPVEGEPRKDLPRHRHSLVRQHGHPVDPRPFSQRTRPLPDMRGSCPADVSGNTRGTGRGPPGAGRPSPGEGRAGSAWTPRPRRTNRSSGAARAGDRTTRAPRSRRSRDPPSNPPASRPGRRPAAAPRIPSRHCSENRASASRGLRLRYVRDLRPLTAIPLDATAASLHTPLRGTPRYALRTVLRQLRAEGARIGMFRLRRLRRGAPFGELSRAGLPARRATYCAPLLRRLRRTSLCRV